MGPETDGRGNAYYKIDPQLMTDFMDKVRTTQFQIQQDLVGQKREIVEEHERRRKEFETWMNKAGTAIKEKIEADQEDLKKETWAKQVQEKLATPDTITPWRTQIDSTIKELITQARTQMENTDNLSRPIGTTVDQVKRIHDSLGQLSSLERKYMHCKASSNSRPQNDQMMNDWEEQLKYGTF